MIELDKTLFITFVLLNIANVIIQTIKSLCTIKGSKWVAAWANCIAYALYTYVVIYMVCDLPNWLKATVIGLANLIGVFIVKAFEEKMQKDKLWKIESTIQKRYFEPLLKECKEKNLTFNYIDIEKFFIFNFYAATKADSKKIGELLKKYEAKYFASESLNIY